jgi:hypothetical protein
VDTQKNTDAPRLTCLAPTMLLLVCLATIGLAATVEHLDGWTVTELRSDQVPPACREWDQRRGMLRVVCPPGAAVAGRVIHTDVGAALAAEKLGTMGRQTPSFFQAFRSLAEINAQLELYRSTSSSVTLEVLGTTTEGRNITLTKISSGAPNLPICFLTGTMHAREWLSPMTLMYVIDSLRSSVMDPLSPLAAFEWHIIVVSNPDGFQYSWTTERYWRKNRGQTSLISCVGIDLNRNFADHWGVSGSSTNPCSENYQGPSPASGTLGWSLRSAIKAKRKVTP